MLVNQEGEFFTPQEVSNLLARLAIMERKEVRKVYKKYIIDKETIPLTTKEKAKKSVNRSYQSVDNLAKANAESFKYFITLTFADKLEDEKYKKLNKERKEGEYNLNFKYLDINKIKQKYITSSDLFRKNQKGMNSDNFENIYYSEVKSNISYNLPFMVLSVIISYCLACFYIGSNFTSTQSIINAITLSFSLANGVYSGFRNGNKIIINDYKFVLDERIQIIKETYSKIEETSLIG